MTRSKLTDLCRWLEASGAPMKKIAYKVLNSVEKDKVKKNIGGEY